MRVEIKIPSAGESVTEVRIGRWLKSDGDRVERDDAILELETDKANMELTADAAGTLHVTTAAGEAVRVGDVVGYIETESAAQAPAVQAAASAEAQPGETSRAADAPDNLSPAIRRLAREHNVDLQEISGTGRKGRVRKEDVLDYVKARETTSSPAPPRRGPQPVPVPALPVPEKPVAAPAATGERERIVPMTLLRKKIAERLVRAQNTAAILTTFNEIDMTAVQNLRAKYKESFKQKYGVGLGLMSFFVKASIEALRHIPQLNSIIDGDNIVYREYYNIGVAVSTDRGLVVPVLRDADALSFAEVERKIADYAAKAREGKISIDDLSGGTFSITNGGIFGSLLSTPILNPPESGILGMHSIQKRAVVIDDQVQIRPMMYVALSYDHRIVDGKEAVTFLIRIKECLEDPSRLMLGV